MNKYNEQYYIVFNKYNENTLYLKPLKSSMLRNYGGKKLDFGIPLFFENSYKEKDLKSGFNRPIKKAHMNVSYPIVDNEIKSAFENIENESFQLYPSVIIDDAGNYHDDFWLFNVLVNLDCLNLDKCKILEFNNDDSRHSIVKYHLCEIKLDLIKEKDRLVFKPKYSDIGHIIIHESILEVFIKFNADTLNFIKISDWEMGLQFIE